LTQAGVSVYYVLGNYEDTDEGRLMKQIRASIAEYERGKIQERMRRGRRASAKSGNAVTGVAPYGYRLEKGADGKAVLAIVEEEAQVVKLIYQWYVHGDGENGPMSLRKIAFRLTGMSIPTRGDKTSSVAKKQGKGVWARTAVHRIITSETYCGTWHYGKRRRVDKKYVKNPRETWIPVPVPPIVDRESWEAAQKRLQLNKELSPRNRKHPYLVGRRVTCGCCGYAMTGCSTRRKDKVHGYYRCPATYQKERLHTCNLPNFSVQRVDAAVWAWISDFLLNPRNLRQGLEARKTAQEEANRPLQERLELVEAQLVENRRQMERLLDLYLGEDFPKQALTERKVRLESVISALERQQVLLQAKLKETILTDEDIATIEEFAEQVRVGLKKSDFETKRQVIDLLDVRVVLNVEDGQEVAYVKCELGQDALIVSNTTQGVYCQTS
jgi:site-specific DNA recombinase